MPRVKIGSGSLDATAMDVEIARLRDLDIGSLRSRWQTAFRRDAHNSLPRNLLFRILAYRLQADHFGELDKDSERLLDNALTPEAAGQKAVASSKIVAELKPGTILAREWEGQMHRVAVLADGFAWNGGTYPSLSQVAIAITGTHWNGPRFFGLRNKVGMPGKRPRP